MTASRITAATLAGLCFIASTGSAWGAATPADSLDGTPSTMSCAGGLSPAGGATGSLDAVAPEKDPIPGLFTREPPGYDFATPLRLRDLVVSASQDLSGIAHRALERGRRVGIVGSMMLMTLMAAVVATVLLYRRLPRHVERALAPLAAALPRGGREWVAAAAQVIAATAPPLVLYALHAFLLRLTAFDGPGFAIVGILLLAWTYYALVATTLHELVLRPLIPMPAEYGCYLFTIARWLALYGLVFYALLDAAAVLGVPGDVIALLAAMLDLSLVLLMSAFLARKRAVMALFPKLPNRLYQAFVRGFGAAYPVILTLTAATVLLALAGYESLARAVWLRSWAVVGLFLGIVFVLHLLHQVLRRIIVGEAQATAESARFSTSSVRLLDLVGVFAFATVALKMTGLHDPLVELLSAPIYALGERRLSLLMVGEAALVIGVFAFLGRLLRDYLNYQVYPALEVDVGVANAIDVFITYAMIIIGALFALELIGVGIGVLTVFAGALGIGLGFGLQPIANNLTSGLTLVFGRALKRGDWVAHGDTVGMVEEIGMRATSLRTRDAVEYLVPNSEFVSGTIINWTRSSPLVREHVPVGVAYGSDPELVRSILLRVAAATPGVEPEPTPEVWFTGFADNSLDFELLVWMNIKTMPKTLLRSELYFAIFAAFKAADVAIPFPQRDLHLRSVSAESMRALAELSNAPSADGDTALAAASPPRAKRSA